MVADTLARRSRGRERRDFGVTAGSVCRRQVSAEKPKRAQRGEASARGCTARRGSRLTHGRRARQRRGPERPRGSLSDPSCMNGWNETRGASTPQKPAGRHPGRQTFALDRSPPRPSRQPRSDGRQMFAHRGKERPRPAARRSGGRQMFALGRSPPHPTGPGSRTSGRRSHTAGRTRPSGRAEVRGAPDVRTRPASDASDRPRIADRRQIFALRGARRARPAARSTGERQMLALDWSPTRPPRPPSSGGRQLFAHRSARRPRRSGGKEVSRPRCHVTARQSQYGEKTLGRRGATCRAGASVRGDGALGRTSPRDGAARGRRGPSTRRRSVRRRPRSPLPSPPCAQWWAGARGRRFP